MKKARKKVNDKSLGFSLIEILVVVSLMALLAIFLVSRADDPASKDKFYRTCCRMEKIKEAITGKQGHYCNGIPQLAGYVSDMGNLPNLYCFDKGEWQKFTFTESGEIKAGTGVHGLAEALKQGIRPQPRALWQDITGGLPEWKYDEDAQLWAGWRGPYIEPSPSGELRDAWGNEFLFVIGEVVGYEGKTYCCKKTYVSGDGKMPYNSYDPDYDKGRRPRPCGPESDCGGEYWEVINEKEMNFRTWRDVGTDPVPVTKREIFHDGYFTIISLGANGEPGGDGKNRDISLVVESGEWLGEVAGNVGDTGEGNLFANKVCVYYPNYTEQGGGIEKCCTEPLQDNSEIGCPISSTGARSGRESFGIVRDIFDPDAEYSMGINFRFGTAPAVHTTVSGSRPSEYNDPNHVKKNITIGIRTLKADAESYYTIFVGAGGNWVGTVKGE